MTDKFLFKWNNFQSTVARSFGVLRAEEEFFDVTLVSDDQVTVLIGIKVTPDTGHTHCVTGDIIVCCVLRDQ